MNRGQPAKGKRPMEQVGFPGTGAEFQADIDAWLADNPDYEEIPGSRRDDSHLKHPVRYCEFRRKGSQKIIKGLSQTRR